MLFGKLHVRIAHVLISAGIQTRVPPVEMEPGEVVVPAAAMGVAARAAAASAPLNPQGDDLNTPVDASHRREALSAVHHRLRVLQEAAARLDRQGLSSYRVRRKEKKLTLTLTLALALTQTVTRDV